MDLEQIVADARTAFATASDAATLENEKARFLGKAGKLTELLKGLGKLDPETRKAEGARINIIKQQVEEALTARRQALADALMDQRLATEAIDVTLPGRGIGKWQPAPRDAHLGARRTNFPHHRFRRGRRSRNRKRLVQLHCV